MEIALSKKTITNAIVLLLITAAAIGGYAAWTRGWFDRLLVERGTHQSSPEADPAIQSLAALYAPSGERVEWEEQVCRGMTVEGCQLFRAMFANPIWNSTQDGVVSVAFIEVAETLEDGSQVWETNISNGDAAKPVYIHVAQNETGQWLLNRVLFTQETGKYETK